MSALVSTAIDSFGGLDIMVNNAGVSGTMHRRFLDDDLADFHQVMGVNLLGVMAGTATPRRHTAEHGGGSILNLTSIGGIQAGGGDLTYRASKAAVIQFTKSAAIELAYYDIRVNAIAPGNIRTAIVSKSANAEDRQRREFEGEHPRADAATARSNARARSRTSRRPRCTSRWGPVAVCHRHGAADRRRHGRGQGHHFEEGIESSSMTERTTDAELVIDIAGLHKSFGDFEALRGLDLRVERGQVHGFPRSQWRGKPTTIRVLLGLLAPMPAGSDCWAETRGAMWSHCTVGWPTCRAMSLWPSMTGGEAIDLLGSMRAARRGRRADLSCSGSNWTRASAAGSIPRATGRRSPSSRRSPRRGTADSRRTDLGSGPLDGERLSGGAGRAAVGPAPLLLLSSHIMAELETLADRLSIIRDGVIVESGTLTELRGQARTTVHADLATLPAHEQLSMLYDVELRGHRLTATVDSDRIGQAMEGLLPFGLTALTVEPPSLESLFLRLYEDEQTPDRR